MPQSDEEELSRPRARWWRGRWRHVVAIVMIIYCLVLLLYVPSVSPTWARR